MAETLLANGLTLVGTLKKNKTEIPQSFQRSTRREVFSSEFGSRHELTLCSYVPKKGYAVYHLSNHHNSELSERDDKKPQNILDYNSSKGAVDTLDQCAHSYSCSRKINIWPTKLAMNMIDIMAWNGLINFMSNVPDWKKNN